MHRFRSRVSVILLAVIVASILPVIFFDQSIDPDQTFLAFGILALTIGLIGFLLFSLRYEIGESHLAIKIGPIPYYKIKLNEIQAVERSYNPLSSPASSLKRLYVSCTGRDVIISPANEKEFIRLLKARNPNIKVEISDKDDWWRFWDWDI